jgi:RluA family pseudouridine synthase
MAMTSYDPSLKSRRRRHAKTTVGPLQTPINLTDYLADRFTYLDWAKWVQEIKQGRISIDGIVQTAPSTFLRGGETIDYDTSAIIEPQVDDDIAILHQDADFIAVNKTGNLPVHPAGRYFHHTLTALLEDRLDRKVYPVHRIDRETSGVCLLAFSGAWADKLARALAKGSKEYLALVHGAFPDGETIIDLPLGLDRDSPIAKKRRASKDGDEKAITRFLKRSTNGIYSFVSCFPETGRHHQIRAHLEAAGFPIVGDKLYGCDPDFFLEFVRNGLTDELRKHLVLPRTALHAARVAFSHPDSKRLLVLTAPLPRMFQDFFKENFKQPIVCPE